MSWYNPASWFETKELTLDQLAQRLIEIRANASAVAVNPNNAMRAPTVYAIVNVISSKVAMLPLMVFQDQSTPTRRRRVPLPQDNVSRLLTFRPNRWQTAFDYKSLMVKNLLLWGNHYAEIGRASNQRITGLEPLDPGMVSVERLGNRRLAYHVTREDGTSAVLPQSQVHHVRGLVNDGAMGVSPIEQVRDAIALEIAAEQFGSTVFGSGAIPNGIITRKGKFKDEEAASRFKRSWNAAFRKKRGTAVLEEGWEFKPVQMNNEESQFLETRKHQRNVIAGALGVPPHLVGDLERATFSNIEHQALEFVSFTLAPYLEAIEAAIARDLLPTNDVSRGLSVEFDTHRLLRGDTKSRAEAMKILREWGIINANEWRAMEGLDAREDDGGDDYLQPMNYTATGDPAGTTAPREDDDEDEPPQPAIRAVPRG